MFAKVLYAAVGLSMVTQAVAQNAPSAAQSQVNWDVFQKLYPKRALAAKEEGAVAFNVTLDSSGSVTGCEVTRSSGHQLLDEETCKLVTLNAVFKPDQSLGPSQTKTYPGLITWRLPNSPSALTQPTAVASSKAPEKMICRKIPRTGTLAGFERTCMTPTDWNRQREALKEPWEDLQGKKGSTSGN